MLHEFDSPESQLPTSPENGGGQLGQSGPLQPESAILQSTELVLNPNQLTAGQDRQLEHDGNLVFSEDVVEPITLQPQTEYSKPDAYGPGSKWWKRVPNLLRRTSSHDVSIDPTSDVNNDKVSDSSTKDKSGKSRLSRRRFLGGALAVTAGAAMLGAGMTSGVRARTRGDGGSPDGVPTPTPPADNPSSTPDTGSSPEVNTSSGELRAAADRAGLEVGLDFRLANLPTHGTLYSTEFNTPVLYYPMRWSVIEPVQGDPNYKLGDDAYDSASQDGRKPVGHNIIFANDYPDWLKNGNFSKEDLANILTQRVAGLVGHQRGKINRWSVTNESHPHPYYKLDDVFDRVIGKEEVTFTDFDGKVQKMMIPAYISMAFQAARNADPEATLIYNDFDNETRTGSNALLTKAVVDTLHTRGLIDGVGLQMHVDGSKYKDYIDVNGVKSPAYNELVKTMRAYGVPVYITEMDVRMQGVPLSDTDRFKKQANVYSTVVQAALDSGRCKSISFWNAGDKYSVMETDTANGWYSPISNPTLFYDDLTPKPAYFAVCDVLKTLPAIAA